MSVFDRFLKFHAPNPLNDFDLQEFNFIKDLVNQQDEDVLRTLSKTIGRTAVEERLDDLAKHNLFTPGSIPVVYVPSAPQSHNMLVGVPYTGNYIARVDDLSTIIPHELSHTVLGKFNDGIAEPIASLFIKSRSHLKGTKRIDRILTRGILEWFEDAETVCSLRSLKDLFKNRPTFRNIVAHFHRGQSTEPPANESTHEFVHLLARDAYGEDFTDYAGIDLPITNSQERRQIREIRQSSYREVMPFHLINPNENAGIARGLATQLGRALMNELLFLGLNGKKCCDASPEEARESIRKLLVFYFEPFEPASLKQYGLSGWSDLQQALLAAVTYKTEAFVNKAGANWYEFREQLIRDPRYQPSTWATQSRARQPDPLDELLDRSGGGLGGGPNSRGGMESSGAELSSVKQELNSNEAQQSKPGGNSQQGGPPPPIFHPIVAAAMECPDNETTINLTRYLGRDCNYDQYLSLGEDSA